MLRRLDTAPDRQIVRDAQHGDIAVSYTHLHPERSACALDSGILFLRVQLSDIQRIGDYGNILPFHQLFCHMPGGIAYIESDAEIALRHMRCV